MRILVLGGTRFIGRAIVEQLAGADHQLLIVHRGQLEPTDMPPVRHLHTDRLGLVLHRDEIAAFNPEAAIDCRALTRSDAVVALDAVPPDVRWIVISSLDVYRAFGAALEEQESDPVPLDEKSPVRSYRYPYRGKTSGMDDYDKLDVEETYLARDATVLRLPMVYGEHDYQRREEFILRRVRAGRTRIPFGGGQWLACRGYVRDIARGVELALHNHAAVGGIFNLCEDRTYSMRMWARWILRAAGFEAELVRVGDDKLPDDLKTTGTMSQHIAASARKARTVLGWTTSDPWETLRTTVLWHLDNPPANPDLDFSADDRALGTN